MRVSANLLTSSNALLACSERTDDGDDDGHRMSPSANIHKHINTHTHQLCCVLERGHHAGPSALNIILSSSLLIWVYQITIEVARRPAALDISKYCKEMLHTEDHRVEEFDRIKNNNFITFRCFVLLHAKLNSANLNSPKTAYPKPCPTSIASHFQKIRLPKHEMMSKKSIFVRIYPWQRLGPRGAESTSV